MKLLLALSLLLSVDNQAMAGKITMPQWMHSGNNVLYLPISVLTTGFVATTTFYLTSGEVYSLIPVVGTAVTAVTGLGSCVVSCMWAGKMEKRARGYIGKRIIFRDDDSNLKSGEVVGYAPIDIGRHTEMYLAGKETSISFKDILATLIPSHRDVGREIEILTEADDTQALHYAGRIVHVFDNGFYELELIAKIDSLPDPSLAHDNLYIDIEPRRIIVNKNASLADGGFRFSRDSTRRTLRFRDKVEQLQQPSVMRTLLASPSTILRERFFSRREQELLLNSASTRENADTPVALGDLDFEK